MTILMDFRYPVILPRKLYYQGLSQSAKPTTFSPLEDNLFLKISWPGHKYPPRSKLFCCVKKLLSLQLMKSVISKLKEFIRIHTRHKMDSVILVRTL